MEAETVSIAEEQHLSIFTLGSIQRFDPLTPTSAVIDGADETDGTMAGVGAVMAAHDGLDGLGGFVGVVEGDGGDVVVQDVGFDDAVKELAADEAKLAIDGGGGAACKIPNVSGVMGKRGVGVLEVGNSHY